MFYAKKLKSVQTSGKVYPPGTDNKDQMSPVGVLCHVQDIRDDVVEDGKQFVSFKVTGMQRVKAPIKLADELLYGHLEPLKDQFDRENEEALIYLLLRKADDIVQVAPEKKTQVDQILFQKHLLNLSELVDVFCGILVNEIPPDQVLDIISELNVETRAKKAVKAIHQYTMVKSLQSRLDQALNPDTQSTVELSKLHKELQVLLNLNSKDDEEDLVASYEAKIQKLPNIPPAALKAIRGEISKLKSLEPHSAEYHVSRNYLDLATSLPWGIFSEDILDLERAEKILSEEHFGMEDIKKRILEFIAVASLNGSIQGKILCFAGPPGVGKTSIAGSIAKALGRKYYRISVGGMDDPTEIKGHRRTYVGSMSGRIIQALKASETSNPVILIDEIDKLSRSSRGGDPSAALLEVLDPSQNHSFLDHYLDTPYDISKVLFLATANYLERIPGPLYDRLEVLEISGYTDDDKMQIAKNYLVPNSCKECGLNSDLVELSEDALEKLISSYCNEPGVRNLQRYVDRVFRKLAYEVSTCKEPWVKKVITAKEIESYVGNPTLKPELFFEGKSPPGYVIGLYAAGMNGGCLPIESIVVGDDSKGNLLITGNLGQVISESTSIAWSFCKKFLEENGMSEYRAFFDTKSVHTHLPDGAVPKEGPSAGITIVTSLLSLAMNKSARSDVAMTGEITLNGKVLAIGGVQAKALGALRNGVETIILPKANESDWSEVSDQIKQEIKVHFAQDYSDVFAIMFPELADENVSDSETNKSTLENESSA
jgi:Lon-like ATP-dependent protease